MPQIKTGFTLRSKAPNFDRDCFDSLYDMKHVSVGYMDEGHLSYCKETKKYYTFDSMGKYRDDSGYFQPFTVGNSEDNEDRLSRLEEMVAELYNNLYPVSCSLTYNGSSSYVAEYKKDTAVDINLNIGVKYRGESLDKGKIESLNVTSDDSVSVGEHDRLSNTVNVKIPSGSNSSHKVNLQVKAVGQNISASCTIYQKSASYVGWSTIEEANTSMLTATSTMTKKLSTSVTGTYNYGTIPAGSYFWVLVPEGVNGFNIDTAKANDQPMVLIEAGNIISDGVTYSCFRTPDKSIMETKNWKIVLSA